MSGTCQIVHRLNHEVLVLIPEKVKMYEKVYDRSGNKIGKIVRILGPVSKPYGVVKTESPLPEDVGEVYTR